MSVTLTENDVTRYVDAVREALSDLPAAQRDELLDDLTQHLQEVAAEGDAPLSVRLGSPAAYAVELRTSIGLTAPAPPAGRRVQRLAAGLAEARDAVVDHPTGRAVLAFLPELRPGWWVLRGYLLVAVPSVLFDYTGAQRFPWPTVSGSRLLGLLATLAAIVASVGLGRRTVRDPGWRRLVVVVNTLLVLAALVAFGSGRVGPESSGYPSAASPGYLVQPDGTPITNIFPYGADGKPLTGVRLFDQDGRPIENVGYSDYGVGYERHYATDAEGNQAANAYPLEEPRTPPGISPRSRAVPTAVPLVSPAPTASPLPTAAPSPSASPSPQTASTTPVPPSAPPSTP